MSNKVMTFTVPEALRHLKAKKRSGMTQRRYNRFTLRKDALEWCKQNCKRHWFLSETGNVWNPSSLQVSFYDHDEAMLFKLTWL